MPVDTTPSYPFPGDRRIEAAARDLADVLADLPTNDRFVNAKVDRTHRAVLASELVNALAQQKGHTKAAAVYAIHRMVTAQLLTAEVAIEPGSYFAAGGRNEEIERIFAADQGRPFNRKDVEPFSHRCPDRPLHDGNGPVPYDALLVFSTDALWRANADPSPAGPPRPEGEPNAPAPPIELGPEFEPVRNWLVGRYLSDPTPASFSHDGGPIVYERYEPFRDFLLSIGVELLATVDQCMAVGWICDLYADISLAENPTPPPPGIARLDLPVGRHRLIGIRRAVLARPSRPAAPVPAAGAVSDRQEPNSSIPMRAIETRPTSAEPHPQSLAVAMQAVVEEMKLAVRAKVGPVENGRRVVRYGDLTGRVATKGFTVAALEWAIHRHREEGRLTVTPGHVALPTVIGSGSGSGQIPAGARSVSREDCYLCPGPTLFDWWYNPRPPCQAFPGPYHELADVLHELFLMAGLASTYGWGFHPSQVNPMTRPWDPREDEARQTSVRHGIPFSAFDPVLRDARSELGRLIQVASGTPSVPFSALDTTTAEIVRRLRELGATYAGAPPTPNTVLVPGAEAETVATGGAAVDTGIGRPRGPAAGKRSAKTIELVEFVDARRAEGLTVDEALVRLKNDRSKDWGDVEFSSMRTSYYRARKGTQPPV